MMLNTERKSRTSKRVIQGNKNQKKDQKYDFNGGRFMMLNTKRKWRILPKRSLTKR
jgi:hypothetical protein